MSEDYNRFGEAYFVNRHGKDSLRQKSFAMERDYIISFLGKESLEKGKLLDVGCSTGEFIEALGWNRANCYGMEVSDYARSIAQTKEIKFTHDLFNSEDFFNLVVYRGTIQYLPNPFEYLKKTYTALKKDGHVVFLATPNTNSIYYRSFQTLPFLEEHLNYLIPCDVSLSMNLRNCGFEIMNIDYPYLRSPYSKFVSDHYKFLIKLIFKNDFRFAFWKSSINMVARKI